MKHTRYIFFLYFYLILFYSCKPSIPQGILSEGDMEEVLYDYHIAKGLANQKSGDSLYYYTRFYNAKVFEKHGINQALFDSSMIWYSRHTERLNDIYNRLSERMGNSSDIDNTPNFLAAGQSSANGDTLNMWPMSNHILLHSKGTNYSVFKEKTDTLIYPGDALIWKFSTDWYYNEGSKQAIVALIAHFSNDSTAMSSRLFYESTAPIELSLYARNDTIKEIEGFIYQPCPWTKRPRMISISDIQLLRVRRKPIKPTPDAPQDKPLMQSMSMGM